MGNSLSETQIADFAATDELEELERLQAENFALRLAQEGLIKRKKNGSIQVYGVRDTPITLTPDQWEQLGTLGPSIEILRLQWKAAESKKSE